MTENLLEMFLSRMNKTGFVLETGTKRYGPNSTSRRHLWPEARKSLGVDFEDGLDVDVVADLEELSKHFDINSVDAIFSASTFEHIRRPWIAAQEMLKVLKKGGVMFVQSHEHFPRHSFPFDYWRFTPMAWDVLFEGASEIITASEYPCKIVPTTPIQNWSTNAPSFLNSVCLVVK